MGKAFKMKFFYFTLLSLFSLICYAQDIEKDNWKLVNEEDEIEVYTRAGENSSLKEIRITCTVKSTMKYMVDFLSDVPLYTDWVYKCDSSLLLNQASQSEFSYYITLDFPFPFEDRDLSVDSKHWIDPITGIFHSTSVASKNVVDPNDEFIHMSEFESTWKITPISQEELRIDYNALSNPGGNIPVWLINLAIAKGPTETMKRLIEMVEKNSLTTRKF